jgi:hypothetical protein
MRQMIATCTVMVAAVLAPREVLAADPDAKSSSLSSGGYGAPELKVTPFGGSPGILLGSQGGWIINHHFIVGGAGYGLVNDIGVSRGTDNVGRLQFAYGGVRLGAMASLHERVHLVGGVILGGAGVSVGDRDAVGTWAIEPDAGVAFSLLKWLRLGLSASYRFVGAASEAELRAPQISGPAAGLTVQFGKF